MTISARTAELTRSLPAGTVVTDPDVMATYARDSADLVPSGTPVAVVRPDTTEQVQEAVRWAAAERVPIVPRGAGTGLSGGANAIDGGLVISLERMDSIREIDAVDQVAVVEAGVVNADVSRAAAASGLFYPPDPGSFEISTIGGNIATNAGGMRCVKYGVTRASVLGLEVVLADGSLLSTGGRTLKNVVGLDLTHLMIGSEGTLGIITAATLRLRGLPASPPVTFVANFDTLAFAGEAVLALSGSRIPMLMLELMDGPTVNAIENARSLGLDRSVAALIIGQVDSGGEGDSLAERLVSICEEAGANFAFATSELQESELLLQSRRAAGFATMKRGPSIIEDVGVPPSRLTELMIAIQQISSETGIAIATVAHAGDGNLHPILMLDDLGEKSREAAWKAADRICSHALALGGTISGEHGVGLLKRRWVEDQLDHVALDVQRRVKSALDPTGLLNPGKGF